MRATTEDFVKVKLNFFFLIKFYYVLKKNIS